MKWRLLAAALIVAAGIADVARSDEPPATATHVVTIQNMQFDPAELIVKRGTRVVWINKDLFPHTATATAMARAKAFDSGSIAAEASWSYVADRLGDYAYVCAFHPTMQGRLVVQ